MRQLSPDPLALAADAIGAGVELLVVTLGAKGAVYVAAPGFDGWTAGRTRAAAGPATVRSALISTPRADALDPTGCGDVFGASLFARLIAGDPVEAALAEASRLAARNVAFRGASSLSRHLRGELVMP